MTPSPRQLRADGLKHVQLFFGLRARVIRGGGEVRHQAFQPHMFGGADRLQNLRRRTARSQASHAAVDFQMIIGRNAASARHAIPFRNIAERMNHRRQIVVEQAGSFGGQEIRHY